MRFHFHVAIAAFSTAVFVASAARAADSYRTVTLRAGQITELSYEVLGASERLVKVSSDDAVRFRSTASAYTCSRDPRANEELSSDDCKISSELGYQIILNGRYVLNQWEKDMLNLWDVCADCVKPKYSWTVSRALLQKREIDEVRARRKIGPPSHWLERLEDINSGRIFSVAVRDGSVICYKKVLRIFLKKETGTVVNWSDVQERSACP